MKVFNAYYIFSTLFFTVYGFTFDDFSKDCGYSICDEKNLTRTDNEAQIGQFPWLARIGIYGGVDKSPVFFCSGALIHERIVLTAAHCATRAQMVRLGHNNMHDSCIYTKDECSKINQDIVVKQAKNADHCRMSKKNDITLLELKEPARLNSFVRTICLPDKPLMHKSLMNRESLMVLGLGTPYSGFGNINITHFLKTKKLMTINPKIVEPTNCKPSFEHMVEENQFCVQYPDDIEDPCVADSGSPLFIYLEVNGIKRAHLIGIASHDLITCEVNKTNTVIYTDVSHFIGWITSTINGTLPKVEKN